MTITVNILSKSNPVYRRTRIWSAFSAALLLFFAIPFCTAQTALTGALNGLVTDSTGASVPGAKVVLTNQATGEVRTSTSGSDGRYNFSLVSPGTYRAEVTMSGFKSESYPEVHVSVTETAVLNAHLSIGAATETVTVTTDQEMVQTDTSALGRTVDSQQVTGLPLVTRAFTQILGLSPGVTTPLTNAADLGRGSSASSGGAAGAKTVNGARPTDNNFEMNGIPINDNLAVGSGSVFGLADVGGGIPTPNPDTIQQFKVQTGQYDASFGRDAGADVNIVTKTGSNQFHGTVFEFFRNNVLNANDYISNSLGDPRGVLRQNQFGFTLGGPIVRNKLLAFGSYQGTRQLNGITGGCSAHLFTPPITNGRSAAGLGAVFQGRAGAIPFPGQVTIAADGSNINPIALAIFQLKLANGSYLIPTPQQVDNTRPFDAQGISSFNPPCSYDENQFMTNMEYDESPRSQFAIRYFQLLSNQNYTMGSSSVPGIPSPSSNIFRDASLTHTYIFSSNLVNEFVFGWNQATAEQPIGQDFTLGNLGSNVPSDFGPASSLDVIGGTLALSPQGQSDTNQPNYALADSVAFSRGKHTVRFGGMFDRNYFSMGNTQLGTNLYLLSVEDLLLGLPGGFGPGENGTPFSNIAESYGGVLLSQRKYLRINGALYIQDDYKATRRLTLNLGARYDRMGALGDSLGRSSTFNLATADPNPPATGSYDGYVVAGNYNGPALPTGVTRSNHSYAINGDNQNAISPRLGFAYQILPGSSRVIVRGGFGMYNSEPSVWSIVTSEIGPPWFYDAAQQGTINPSISLQNPFGPGPFLSLSQLPQFTPYSAIAPIGQLQYTDVNFRPGYAEVYDLNLQEDLGHNYMAEVGYVGTKGVHLSRGLLPNLANSASASDPIRGATTNTIANIQQRVPYSGFTPAALVENNTEGSSNFNSLQASLTKRYSNGLQFLASYTFSKTLDADGVNVIEASAGTAGDAYGNNLRPRADYGRTNLDRPHRFVVSYLYDLPGLKGGSAWERQILNKWQLTGVTTIQSGPAITVTATNTYNAFGQTNDFAPLSGKCRNAGYVTSGSKSAKVNEYFNLSCFNQQLVDGVPTPVFSVIGADGLATDYAKGGVGVTNAPGQDDWDIAIVKRFSLKRRYNIEFRSEFFNAFNHAQLGAPNTAMTGPTFGEITSVSANPRIIQFALKLNF
jgi:Carboxypeptidase regulatory-like domain